MSKDEDLDLLTAALQRLEARHGTFRCDLSFEMLMILIAQLQLALRHPANRGAGALQARQFVEDVIDRFEKAEPGLAAFLRRGFDPAQDVPIDLERPARKKGE